MRPSDLWKGYDLAFGAIDGWFQRSAAEFFRTIDQVHQGNGLAGSILEIGVYAAKSFLPLCYLANAQHDRVIGVDPQVQRSCHKNLETLACGCDFELLPASSVDVPMAALGGSGSFRLVHVDGCHDQGFTASDLRLADYLLADHGVVVIDDVFNHQFPSVSCETNAWIAASQEGGPPCWKPVVIGFNKVVVARSTWWPAYFQAFKNAEPKCYGSGKFHKSTVLLHH